MAEIEPHTIHDMVDEMLAFCGVEPSEPIDGNVGTVWFTDRNTGKQFFIAIGECVE